MNTIWHFIAIILVFLTFPGTLQLIFLTATAMLPRRIIFNSNNFLTINLAIIIPAHNEEIGIKDTIESIQSCSNPLNDLNIFVIADNCVDSTAEVSKQCGVSVLERNNDHQLGKGYALNFAFNKIAGMGFDAFVVVDADTVVDKNFIDSFRKLFAKGESAGQATYRVKNAELGIRPRLMNIAFLAFNYLRPLGRDNVNLSAGILGNGFGVSKATLEAVPYDSFSIVEDLEYHIRLIKSGVKVRFLSSTSVWSNMPVTSAEAQSQRERWEGGRLHILKEQVPDLILQILKGRFKLIEPLFELLLLPLAFHVVLLLALLLISPIAYKFYALFAIAIVVLHVVIAMLLGKASWQDWKALLYAPFYLLWKLAKLGGILKSARKGAAWKRTDR